MLQKTFLLFFILCCLHTLRLSGQSSEWLVQADKGFILKHSLKVGHLVATHPNGYTISYQKQYIGKEYWQKYYHYPKVSLAFTIFDYHSNYIGNTLALALNAHLPLFSVQKRKQLEFKIGTGLVYCTKPFDIEKNPKNTFLSQKISTVMNVEGIFSYQVFPRWRLLAGLQLTHYSNGSSTLPNNGINIMTTTFGVAFNPSNKKISYLTPERPVFQRNLGFQASIATSRAATYVGQTNKYMIIATGLYATYQINRINVLNAGIDVSWSERVRKEIDRTYSDSLGIKKPDYRRVSVVFGNEIMFGKVSLLIQAGVYVYRQFEAKNEMWFYQRYGLKYYPKPKIFLGFLLKTHANNAECVELVVGGRFGKRNP
jgi:hypothetical protein